MATEQSQGTLDAENFEDLEARSAAGEDTSESERKRERSQIDFPYLDLDDAVELAKAVHAAGGTGCLIEQLAGHLHVIATGGGFRGRLQTAKVFGLVTYDRTKISLTAIGQKVCDDRQEAQGRSEAFLTVPLYNKVYETYRGGTLPANSGLENSMVDLGVAPKQKVKARQVFQRSAQQAGFFAHGGDRLVIPSIRNGGQTQGKDVDVKEESPEKQGKKNGGSGGSGSHYDPLIEGLLNRLPPADSPWSMLERRKWLQTAAMNFEMLYRDPDDNGDTIRVEIKKDSAQ
jgi:hypothetical protein